MALGSLVSGWRKNRKRRLGHFGATGRNGSECDPLDRSIRKIDTEVIGEPGVHFHRHWHDENVGIDELQGRIRGIECVAKIRRAAHAPVLQSPDQAEVGELVEESQDREPWILEDADERPITRWPDHQWDPRDRNKRCAEGVGDDREIRVLPEFAENAKKA